MRQDWRESFQDQKKVIFKELYYIFVAKGMCVTVKIYCTVCWV